MATSANITRRRALTSIAAIPAMGTAAIVPALAEPVEAPAITPRQRLNAAIDELKAAVTAMDPLAADWDIGWAVDESLTIRFCAMAKKNKAHVATYVDDGSPLRADDVTGTTAYADWEQSRA